MTYIYDYSRENIIYGSQGSLVYNEMYIVEFDILEDDKELHEVLVEVTEVSFI